HEEVRECVVVTQEDGEGGRHLVAYVVGKEGREAEAGKLREHLRRKLPEYMVPGWIVGMKELPLTRHGKVDRKGLPRVTGTGAGGRLGERKGAGEEVRRVERAGRERPLPLSYAQQRLWFIEQLEPGSTAYNMPLRLRLRGELDREALKRSVREIVRRHEVLRTSYEEREGVPVQRVGGEAEYEWEERDLRGVEEEEREREAGREAEAEGRRSCDL